MHHHYGERCVFFLVRVQEHQLSDSAVPLSDLMSSAGAVSHSIYLLWGYYDVLVRAWVTPATRDRLIQAFDNALHLVAEYEEFQVETTNYLWMPPSESLTPKVIESHRAKIDSVYDAIAAQEGPDTAALLELHADGLIHVLPGRTDNPVKFFVSLSTFPNVSNTRLRGLQAVLNHLSSGDPWVTVYSGIGFASHLLRFAAPSFDEVLSIVEQEVAPLAEKLRMRTTTLIVATSQTVESDEINPRISEIGSVLAALGSILGAEYEMSIPGLPDDVQDQLRRVFSKYSSTLLGGPAEGLFLGLMRSRIDQKMSEVNRELAQLLHFELLFKRFLADALSRQGDDWEARVLEAAHPTSRRQERVGRAKLGEQSLGTLAQGANRLADPAMRARFNEVLGDEWVATIERYTGMIRNPFAHGATFTPEFAERFFGKWAEYAELLCKLGIAFQNLTRA